jgi:hypothetical protein
LHEDLKKQKRAASLSNARYLAKVSVNQVLRSNLLRDEELKRYHNLAVQALADLPLIPSKDPTAPPYKFATHEMLWQFWQLNMLDLPHWFEFACICALVMTSSGCVERLFSLYVAMFGELMERCLEDRRECTIMLNFNNRQRNKFP